MTKTKSSSRKLRAFVGTYVWPFELADKVLKKISGTTNLSPVAIGGETFPEKFFGVMRVDLERVSPDIVKVNVHIEGLEEDAGNYFKPVEFPEPAYGWKETNCKGFGSD